MREFIFHCTTVPDGKILERYNSEEKVYECWTLGKRIDTLINYEFGLPLIDDARKNGDRRMTFKIFHDIVMDNYEDGNLDFDKYFE